MSVLYVKEQGAFLAKNGERIEVSKNKRKLLSVPAANLTDLSIFGNVQISTQAMTYLMRNGVDISIFTRYGEFVGQARANASANIFLRFSQFDIYQNMSRRIEIAGAIVANKIENQMQVIRNYRYVDGFHPKQELRKMKQLQDRVASCATTNELMGMEGMCSNIYFTCFAHMIHCDFEFHGRNRRPPRDPINVILSLAYTFLTKEVCSALEAESFELYLGFLHGIRYGRKSLALDIVEEFRQPVVDRFVVRCFNKRMLNELDFEQEEDRVLLNEDGFQKFCREFEKWMLRHTETEKMTFRKRILRQASSLKKAILEGTSYIPYQWHEKDEICD